MLLNSRLCRWLLQTRDRNDSNHLPLTQEFLSQMLGVRRTTLTLIAQDLQTAGLIRYRRGRIEIVDRNGLEAKACECYGVIRRQSEAVFPGCQVAQGAAPDRSSVQTVVWPMKDFHDAVRNRWR